MAKTYKDSRGKQKPKENSGDKKRKPKMAPYHRDKHVKFED